MAAFLVGISIANMVGSPISGALLTLHGLGGIACLFVLFDEPKDATWLPENERT